MNPIMPTPGRFEVDGLTSLPNIVQGCPQGNDAEAELGDVVEYLVRSKYLIIPKEWWDCFQ